MSLAKGLTLLQIMADLASGPAFIPRVHSTRELYEHKLDIQRNVGHMNSGVWMAT